MTDSKKGQCPIRMNQPIADSNRCASPAINHSISSGKLRAESDARFECPSAAAYGLPVLENTDKTPTLRVHHADEPQSVRRGN